METMTYLIGTYRRAVNWCREHDINPRDKSVVIICSRFSAPMLRARCITDEDRVIWLGDLPFQDAYEVQSMLKIARSRTP